MIINYFSIYYRLPCNRLFDNRVSYKIIDFFILSDQKSNIDYLMIDL